MNSMQSLQVESTGIIKSGLSLFILITMKDPHPGILMGMIQIKAQV